MTGYGSGRRAGGGSLLTAEIRAVNHRQGEVVANLPRELAACEPAVRELVHAAFARGRLTVNVGLQPLPAGHAEPAAEHAPPEHNGRAPAPPGPGAAADPGDELVDLPLARAYHRAMCRLRDELGLAGEAVSLDAVLRAPGVLRPPPGPVAVAPEAAWPPLAAALREALGHLEEMRGREGAALARDLAGRAARLRELVGEIATRQPAVLQHHRQALRTRLDRAGLEVAVDDDRLAKEFALFADRSDVTEELTRLASHLDQFAGFLRQDEPVGRTLDFLGQEIARELNTIGAKAGDAPTSQLVVAAKAELEKIREQVQNVE